MKLLSPARLGLPAKIERWHYHQERAIWQIVDDESHRFIAINAPTGCHAAGTRIVMFDGSVRLVEHVHIGDVLMGPDGQPRTVLRLHQGKQQMVRVTPTKGDDFIVNMDHMLSVYKTNEGKRWTSSGPRLEVVTPRQWLAASQTFRHNRKLRRSPAIENFAGRERHLPIDPYFLGVLIGDGSMVNGLSVCTPDPEIAAEVYKQAGIWGLDVRVEERPNNKAKSYCLGHRRVAGAQRLRNDLLYTLGVLNMRVVCESKFIPFDYLTADVSSRRALLAGLLDTDGYLQSNHFEIICKGERLREDILFLARSLGLAAYWSEKRAPKICDTVYYRITISGELAAIPTRLPRKQATPRRQKKSVLVTGFKIELLDTGTYYGFEIDGDHLYLTGDFTIHHNSGKTGIALAVAQLLPRDERVLFLTSTKALQDQIVADAHPMGLRDIRGKSNYKCHAASAGGELAGLAAAVPDDGWVSVEHAPCFTADMQCPLMQRGCEWFDGLREVRSARIVSMNYAKWISTTKPDEDFGTFDWVFCDEAADIEKHLTDALTIELKRTDTERVLGLQWPAGSHPGAGTASIEVWREWAQHHRGHVDALVREAEASFKQGNRNRAMIGRMITLREAAGAVNALRQIRGGNSEWVVDDLRAYDRITGAVFQPVWPSKYTESMLLRGIPRVVLMGATLIEKHLDILGLPATERSFTSYPSAFPVARRPIYICKLDPPLKLSYKAEQDERVQARVVEVGDALMRARMDRNGLAHTVSYKRRNYILARTQHRDVIATHSNDSASVRATVARFKQAADNPPAWLLSPSIETGYDFPLTEAEWCWIPKLPFEQSAGALAQARKRVDPTWLDFQVANRLMQMVGRGMRLPWDSFEAIVTDAQMLWFPWRNRELFAEHFLAALRTVNGLPTPPAKLVVRPRDRGS